MKKQTTRSSTPQSHLPSDYAALLSDLKDRIRSAQLRASLSVNTELVTLYWQIGRELRLRQEAAGWGAKVIERLSADLRRAFPAMKGFSRRNLLYMRMLADTWGEPEFAQQAVAQIPWGHLVRILDKVGSPEERTFYIRSTLDHGWSRDVLVAQIESNLFHRQGRAQTNFARTLPSPQSDLAQQVLKDPYAFDFLSLGVEAHEREIERALMDHMRSFLLELGVGFAFVGNQFRLTVRERDYYIDLLFYHLKLRCFVVIELKAGDFEPEHAGKMNFYLSAVDDLLRHPDDKPSIGIILCKRRDGVLAEYALRDINKPIGVSGFTLTDALPENLKGNLPTIAELEAELADPRE